MEKAKFERNSSLEYYPMNDIGEIKHTSCLIKGVFSPPAVADPGEGPGGGGGRPPYFWTKLRPEGLSLDDRAPPYLKVWI